MHAHDRWWCRSARRWSRPAGTAGLGHKPHDEGRRSGGGVEEKKIQVAPNFNFLEWNIRYYWRLIFFSLNIFLGVGKHHVSRKKFRKLLEMLLENFQEYPIVSSQNMVFSYSKKDWKE